MTRLIPRTLLSALLGTGVATAAVLAIGPGGHTGAGAAAGTAARATIVSDTSKSTTRPSGSPPGRATRSAPYAYGGGSDGAVYGSPYRPYTPYTIVLPSPTSGP